MAAHSTCQPGLPGPNGDGQLGSPGRSATQSSGVEFVALAGPVGIAAALGEQPQHGVPVVARLVAELRRGVGPEVHVRILGVLDDVGGAGGQQLLDQLDDLGDGLGGRDVVTRRQHPQRRHVLAEQLGLPIAELTPANTVAGGPFEQRVVDVGDVLHVVHAVPRVQPHPVDQVERQVGGGVAEMGGVVRRDATDVHGGRLARRNGADLAVGTVEKAQLRALPRKLRDCRRRPRLHGIDSRVLAQNVLPMVAHRSDGTTVAPITFPRPGSAPQNRERMAPSSVSASSVRHITKSGRYGSGRL